MRYLGLALAGLLLTSGCVVHQAVPVAATPSDTTTAPAAQNCREFQDTVTVGGTQQRAFGTTCQQPDGSWRIAAPQPTSPPATGAPAPYPVYPAYAYPYPYYPYPYYGYPAYYGPAIGFRFSGHFH